MVDLATVNWIIVGIEILFAFLWSCVFFTRFFPFLELNRVKYNFNEKYKFDISKTAGAMMRDILQSIGNLMLVILMLLTGYHLANRPVPLLNQFYESLSLPNIHPVYLIAIGLVGILIPRFVLAWVMPPYMIRQVKYFLLISFILLPLFLLDLNSLEELSELSDFVDNYGILIGLLLPAQLLTENGIELTMGQRIELFHLGLILAPFCLTLIYQIIPRLISRSQSYGIFEWKNDQWNQIDDKIYEGDDDTAVLLIHGMGSSKEMWTAFSKERSSERIVDHIKLNTDNRYLKTKIFGIDFSDKLKNSLTSQYRIKTGETLFGEKVPSSLNNYVWELIFAIELLLEVKQIEKIHLVAHSSGGIITRLMLYHLYNHDEFAGVRNRLGYLSQQNSIATIDRIGWLAVPHFGIKGGSAYISKIVDIFPLSYILRVLFLLPYIDIVINRVGILLRVFGLDPQTVNDLGSGSSLLKELNNNKKVVLYGDHVYRNAIAIQDRIVGDGAKIDFAINKSALTDYEEKEFRAKHGFLPWEMHSEPIKEKVHETTAIHHSMETIYWILQSKEE